MENCPKPNEALRRAMDFYEEVEKAKVQALVDTAIALETDRCVEAAREYCDVRLSVAPREWEELETAIRKPADE